MEGAGGLTTKYGSNFDSKIDASLKRIELDKSDERGLLYPLCTQLDRCQDSGEKRADICSKIYIYCSELSHNVSERDVLALYTITMKLTDRWEKQIIMGAYLRLLYFDSPIWDHISASNIVALMCSHDRRKKVPFKLIISVLVFVEFHVNNYVVSQVYKAEFVEVVRVLVELIKYFTWNNFGSLESSQISVLLFAWTLVNEMIQKSNTTVKILSTNHLVESTKNKSFGKEELSSMMQQVCNQVALYEKEEKEKEEKKKNWKTAVHDKFDYTRFDHIDTSDSDETSANFSFGYQTIPGVNLDQTTTDVEDLLEGVSDED